MTDTFIQSPCTANGVTFLLNVLLELNVCIYRDNPDRGPEGQTWNVVNGAYRVKAAEFQLLRNWLPSLHENEYTFIEGPRVCWGHPTSLRISKPYRTLLFLRDPRDALFSWWRRKYRLIGVDFGDYLQTPSTIFKVTLDSLAGVLRETGAIFSDYWSSNLDRIVKSGYGNMVDEHVASYELILQNLRREGVFIFFLKFEDLKTSPLITTLNTLSSIGIEREISSIKDALASSSVDRARYANTTGGGERVIYSGEIYEHRTNKSYGREYEYVRKAMDPVFRFFGYD